MKRAVLATAILAIAVAGFTALTLPARQLSLNPFADGTIAGVVHIHTNRSDGRSSPAVIAEAAARAGLKFVVFTDHGDATRSPDPPTYRSGVLCLDAVEISTSGGHYLAIDMPAAPYPLAGEPRDVVEDVRRLGGFGVAAHPDSPKPELRWTGWSTPFDGIEWVNPDTSWRVRAADGARSRLSLVEALLHYPIRPAETLANLLTDAEGIAGRWASIAATRRVVVMSGADAHANLALRGVDPVGSGLSPALPSYEASFRTATLHARLDRALTGDAADDAAALMRALRSGHAYTAVDGFATPPAFEFTASNALGTVHEGDELGAGGPVTLNVRSDAPPGFQTIVYRNATALIARDERDVTVTAPADPAVYRVEIRSPASTWLYSNGIYVRAASGDPPRAQPPAALESRALFTGLTDFWRTEGDATSTAHVETVASETGPELLVRYRLGPRSEASPHVALVWGTNVPPGIPGYDRLSITARADRPMRVVVELRVADLVPSPRRWRRSLYLDRFDETRTLFFDEFTPAAQTVEPHPTLADVNAIQFFVDPTNTKPGTEGKFWIRSVALQK